MHIYIQTRTKGLDYQFLAGHAPTKTWWTAYKDYTDLEEASLILESKETGWRLYINQIPSKRVDRTRTQIWQSLVLEGKVDSASKEHILSLISHALTEEGRSTLGNKLDNILPEEHVEHLMSVKNEGQKVAEALEDFIHTLSFDFKPFSHTHGNWLYGSSSKHKDIFLSYAAKLLNEPSKGLVACLNYASSPEDVEKLINQYSTLVIIGDLDPAESIALTPKKKSSHHAANTRKNNRVEKHYSKHPIKKNYPDKRLIILGIMGTVAAATLIWWMVLGTTTKENRVPTRDAGHVSP